MRSSTINVSGKHEAVFIDWDNIKSALRDAGVAIDLRNFLTCLPRGINQMLSNDPEFRRNIGTEKVLDAHIFVTIAPGEEETDVEYHRRCKARVAQLISDGYCPYIYLAKYGEPGYPDKAMQDVIDYWSPHLSTAIVVSNDSDYWEQMQNLRRTNPNIQIINVGVEGKGISPRYKTNTIPFLDIVAFMNVFTSVVRAPKKYKNRFDPELREARDSTDISEEIFNLHLLAV